MINPFATRRKPRTRINRAIAPRLTEGWSAEVLEGRSLAAPGFVLADPNNGVGGVATVSDTAGLLSDTENDTENGGMNVSTSETYTNDDWFGDGTDVYASLQSQGAITVTSGGNPDANTNIAITASGTVMEQDSSARNNNPLNIVSAINVGTGNNGGGNNPITWNVPGGAGETVDLTGSVSFSYLPGGDTPITIGGINFRSTATGVTLVTNASGNLVVTYPVDGTVTTYTITNFDTDGGAGSFSYSTGPRTGVTQENIFLNAGMGINKAIGVQGTFSSTGQFEFSFSESISPA